MSSKAYGSSSDVASLPKGLLSFLYNAMYNPDIHSALLQDYRAVMDQFGLDTEEIDIIAAAIDAGKPEPADADKIGNCLGEEFEKNFPAYYDEYW